MYHELYFQPPGYSTPVLGPLPPSPRVARGGSVHPLPLPGAAHTPVCVHNVCWRKRDDHGDGGTVVLDQGGGGRVDIGGSGGGGLPDVAGGIISYHVSLSTNGKTTKLIGIA